MCLSRQLSKEEFKEWLEKQPDTIIAWKVASETEDFDGNSRLEPSCFLDNPFEKTNVKEKNAPEICIDRLENEWYYPNFHLFMEKKDAKKWADLEEERVLKCSIPKKQITTVGYQQDFLTIVTKEFTFLPTKKQKKYFG